MTIGKSHTETQSILDGLLESISKEKNDAMIAFTSDILTIHLYGSMLCRCLGDGG